MKNRTPEYNQTQTYKGKNWNVSRILDFAKDIKVEEIDMRLISKNFTLIDNDNEENLVDFANEMKQVMNVDMEQPILIADCGFVIDGKHRVTRAIFEDRKTIKVKFLGDFYNKVN